MEILGEATVNNCSYQGRLMRDEKSDAWRFAVGFSGLEGLAGGFRALSHAKRAKRPLGEGMDPRYSSFQASHHVVTSFVHCGLVGSCTRSVSYTWRLLGSLKPWNIPTISYDTYQC